MNVEEAKQLNYGDHVERFVNGKVRRFKVNGRPKVWKRRPELVTVPLKYGLYEYGYMSEFDCCEYTKVP